MDPQQKPKVLRPKQRAFAVEKVEIQEVHSGSRKALLVRLIHTRSSQCIDTIMPMALAENLQHILADAVQQARGVILPKPGLQ